VRRPSLNLASRLIERIQKLDPPATRDVKADRDLRVPMPDGTVLLADRYAPRDGGDTLPVLLMRCPYGRRGLVAGMAKPLAERGYQVVMQSARGTFGSGGTFEPMRHEREDGLATIDWVIRQPWFAGSIVLYGPSYLGYVQWAVAGPLPPEVKAMIPVVTESALTLEFLRPDGLSLETPFGWGIMTDSQEKPGAMLRQLTAGPKNLRAMRALPLRDADVMAAGHRVGYVQDILAHDAADPYWAPLDHRDRVAGVTVPVSSVGGWYDIFLPGQLRDFRVLQDQGRAPRLTVGPWHHLNGSGGGTDEALTWGLALARGEAPPERAPVRLFVMGEEAWRDFESWPPAGYAPQRFYLGPDGSLSTERSGACGADRFRYDPADPTPALGGVRMVPRGAGRVENTALEQRPDVLVYTTPPLESDVEVIGDVSAEIWFSSSLRHADVFVRLCDVDEQGKSWNVCDGLTSVTGADAPQAVTVQLWSTAHRFKRGHRIRVQVSSGAFPRFARNPGTGEPHVSATRLLAADQVVHHDADRPSAIILPVREAAPQAGLRRLEAHLGRAHGDRAAVRGAGVVPVQVGVRDHLLRGRHPRLGDVVRGVRVAHQRHVVPAGEAAVQRRPDARVGLRPGDDKVPDPAVGEDLLKPGVLERVAVVLVDERLAIVAGELRHEPPLRAAELQALVGVLHPDDGHALGPRPGDEDVDVGDDNVALVRGGHHPVLHVDDDQGCVGTVSQGRHVLMLFPRIPDEGEDTGEVGARLRRREAGPQGLHQRPDLRRLVQGARRFQV
jgi:uncharacterized protein